MFQDTLNSFSSSVFFGDTFVLNPDHLMKMSRSTIECGEFINLFYEVPETFVTNERTISD